MLFESVEIYKRYITSGTDNRRFREDFFLKSSMLSVPAILPAKSKIYTSPKTYLDLNFLKLSSFGLLIVKSPICVTKDLF
jgi:hypothetical protein